MIRLRCKHTGDLTFTGISLLESGNVMRILHQEGAKPLLTADCRTIIVEKLVPVLKLRSKVQHGYAALR